MTEGAALEERLAAARAGDRVALARLLSVTEADGDVARELARRTWRSARAFSVGITGAPGVGKSTLVDRLVQAHLQELEPAPDAAAPDGHGRPGDVAVLCVDPSSPFSGGAILGDRVRMQRHALDARVFIRSLATRGEHGGLSVAVPDALALLGAAGFPLVLVETVGVGQVELDVATTADATVVVVSPGWGDALQAAKAGLLEVADVFVVNKADRVGAEEAVRDLEQMLDLGAPRLEGWRPPIVKTVATEGDGVDAVLGALASLRAHLDGPAGLARRRSQSAAVLRRLAFARMGVELDKLAASEPFAAAVEALAAGTTDPYDAVEALRAP